MGNRKLILSCKSEEHHELERLSRSHSEAKRPVERARIISGFLGGESQAAVARCLNLRANTVNKWCSRFAKYGITGLEDGARTGAPKKVGKDLRSTILKLLETPPPQGQSRWDGTALAKAVDARKGSAYKVLAQEGIALQRMRSWCVSTDPEFAAKPADVIGPYLNPPERAIVLSVDEKPSIQALSRKRGFVRTSSRKIVQGLQSTYQRNGTLNLFAALNVATGEVKKKTTQTKKREDFIAFMEDVIKDVPETQEVHVILDNYCTHKRNEAWLKHHPDVHFHFTPTSASWLDQVEIWFGILTRKALRNASFNSVDELAKAIDEFTNAYHKNAKPFLWKKREVKGAQLENTIANLLE